MAFDAYLSGLLLPRDRSKTLTALVGAEPLSTRRRRPKCSGCRFFLSESTWDADRVNAQCPALLAAESTIAPSSAGVLVIDDTGDRKDGSATDHVARQYPPVSDLLSRPILRWLTARQRHFMTRTPHSHHSPEFKEQALLKARHRGMRSVISIAGELNMAAGTLRKWLQSSGKAAGTQARYEPTATLALNGPAPARSPAQRLMALQESYALSEVARAAWCREHGAFEHQLAQWHEEFCTPAVPASREAGSAFRELQRQHEQLQRELRRKEKALAEVAALLVLQKNFQALPEGADK